MAFNSIKRNSGFTIVELLIVIVVIAILATISIVAYNGIQTRARVSAAASAGENIAKKLEAYNATTGAYPVFNTAGTITTQLTAQNESTLTGSGLAISGTAAGVTAANGGSTVQVLLCGATAPASGATATGYQVNVFNYTSGSGVTLVQSGGVTTACSTSTSGS